MNYFTEACDLLKNWFLNTGFIKQSSAALVCNGKKNSTNLHNVSLSAGTKDIGQAGSKSQVKASLCARGKELREGLCYSNGKYLYLWRGESTKA